jgi:hypothetical protein
MGGVKLRMDRLLTLQMAVTARLAAKAQTRKSKN